MNILEKANEIINCRSEEKDRMYGPIDEGMEIAAQIFNLITPEGQSITPEGMYWALVALKLSRQHFNHKEDNLLDAVAYIGALNNYIDSKNAPTFENIIKEVDLVQPELKRELKPDLNVTDNYKPY
jgi:hypothetical protein